MPAISRKLRIPAKRWHRVEPLQERSRETADRFAAAAEDLLRDRSFEEISIQDIVRRAGRPTGSFYARFASKEALLPFIYLRYHEDLERVFAARMERVDWAALDFRGAVATLIDVLVAMYLDQRWLIRAISLFARAHPEALPGDLIERRRRVYEPAIKALALHRSRIGHDDPETAIRTGIFMVSSVAREKLLFGDAPLSRITPISPKALRVELARMLFSYLSPEPRR